MYWVDYEIAQADKHSVITATGHGQRVPWEIVYNSTMSVFVARTSSGSNLTATALSALTTALFALFLMAPRQNKENAEEPCGQDTPDAPPEKPQKRKKKDTTKTSTRRTETGEDPEDTNTPKQAPRQPATRRKKPRELSHPSGAKDSNATATSAEPGPEQQSATRNKDTEGQRTRPVPRPVRKTAAAGPTTSTTRNAQRKTSPSTTQIPSESISAPGHLLQTQQKHGTGAGERSETDADIRNELEAIKGAHSPV